MNEHQRLQRLDQYAVQQMEGLQKVTCSVSPDHENLVEACETLPNASSSLASLCLRKRAEAMAC